MINISTKQIFLALLMASVACSVAAKEPGQTVQETGTLLPTGQRITPLAAPGATFGPLNPNLPDLPDFTAGQAVDMVLGPDGKTLLILTSGYNRNVGIDGRNIADQSNEYVFVYDISGRTPVKSQVLQIPNSYNGLAFQRDGDRFFVSGGVDDNVHVFTRKDGHFAEDGDAIKLGHAAGLGIGAKPAAAGVGIDPSGTHLLVANLQNDSVSLIDLASRKVVAEQDLRPGKIASVDVGKPGGTFPFGVAFASDTVAFVSSQRDREVEMLDIGAEIHVHKRIALPGQPNKMLLNKDHSRLFVALDNSDTVAVIDTMTGEALAQIPTAAPAALLPNAAGLHGANPNNLALSPDEHTLFVTNGGLNAVAVVALGRDVIKTIAKKPGDEDDHDTPKIGATSKVIGLLPTGWYPNAVALSHDGHQIYVANGKSNAGPNRDGCLETTQLPPNGLLNCRAKNQYVWQLSKAGFLAMPMPNAAQLAQLTLQVAANNHFASSPSRRDDEKTMQFLHDHIKHVVYIVKENRTYDQVLGDLEVGNGDPALALLPRAISPNHHALASQFVTLDAFLDSGETSNTGWNWTTAARTTDFTEKEAPVNYGLRGLQYDQEGDNRNINVGLATAAARKAANSATPDDEDLLPGSADVAAPDAAGPSVGEGGTGYIWDAALKAGLSVRNYGFYGDLSRYFVKTDQIIPLSKDPFAEKRQVFFPTKASLMAVTDLYYRGFDMAYPDFYRVKEWQREFGLQVAANSMPQLTLLRLPNDHFGQFDQAIDGVNTVETQMADNDYALGKVIETLAASPFAKDTLVFVVEDDAQNGADHIDAHRSMALIAGPYVKHHALISTPYTTVSLLRTVEGVLGLPPLGLNDGLANPMSDVFDETQSDFTYHALMPEVLRSTQLPIETAPLKKSEMMPRQAAKPDCYALSRHDGTWWANQTKGQNFNEEDHLDTAAFAKTLWLGLRGYDADISQQRSGADLRKNRAALLQKTTICR